MSTRTVAGWRCFPSDTFRRRVFHQAEERVLTLPCLAVASRHVPCQGRSGATVAHEGRRDWDGALLRILWLEPHRWLCLHREGASRQVHVLPRGEGNLTLAATSAKEELERQPLNRVAGSEQVTQLLSGVGFDFRLGVVRCVFSCHHGMTLSMEEGHDGSEQVVLRPV